VQVILKVFFVKYEHEQICTGVRVVLDLFFVQYTVESLVEYDRSILLLEVFKAYLCVQKCLLLSMNMDRFFLEIFRFLHFVPRLFPMEYEQKQVVTAGVLDSLLCSKVSPVEYKLGFH